MNDTPSNGQPQEGLTTYSILHSPYPQLLLHYPAAVIARYQVVDSYGPVTNGNGSSAFPQRLIGEGSAARCKYPQSLGRRVAG